MKSIIKKPRDGQRWLWASAITVVSLGGYISTSPIIAMPIHVYAAAVLAVGLVVAFLRKFWWPGAGWILAIWAIFALAMLVHPTATVYGEDKVVQLFTATLLAAVAPLWLLRSEGRHQALIYSLYGFAALVTALAVAFPDNSWRLSLVGTNYIGSGRIISLFFAISLLFFALKVGPRPLTFFLVLISGYAALQTESRGPFIAALAATAVVVLFRVGSSSTRILRIVGGFLAVVCSLLIVVPSQVFQDSRFAGLANPDENVSLRLSFFTDAFRVGATHPLGVGWGNLQLYLSDESAGLGVETLYPHNLLLEVWAEGGWLATTALVVFVIVSLRKMQKSSLHTTPSILWGITLFFLINAFVSADINGNRILFGFLILAWTFDHVYRQPPSLPPSVVSRRALSSPSTARTAPTVD